MAKHLPRAAWVLKRIHPLPVGLALTLTALALPLPALADWSEKRAAALEHYEAQVLTRLSATDRRRYFEARRQQESRGADQRIAELRQMENCLERTRRRAGAETCLSRARQLQEQHRQWELAEISALRQSIGLPPLPASAAGGQSRSNRWTPWPWEPQSDDRSLDSFAPSYGRY